MCCEYPEFFKETKQKARKNYLCCECGAYILNGESYWKSTGKWAGEVKSFHQHTWCRALCTNISYRVGECFAFGNMFDEFIEYCFNEKVPENKKLRDLMARVKWEARKIERRILKNDRRRFKQ